MGNSDYQRVARAITYLAEHTGEQPTLEQIAAEVQLSPFHFQRMFCRWAGTSPKRFLQVLTLERGKRLLEQSRPLLETAHELGLSGGSRLHDHFVKIEAVTPGEHREQGRGISVEHGVYTTPFGPLFLASTGRGICRAAFVDHAPVEAQIQSLHDTWPKARLKENPAICAELVRTLLSRDGAGQGKPLSLLVKGTNFQIAVWRALLNIPPGAVASYGDIARQLGKPGSGRAVGNAVGANPVALFIPCHRVIRESGALGGYRWGEDRKQVIQTWERMQVAEPA